MSENEYLAMHGEPIKALGDGKVGGYLVRFTGPEHPDLEGDYFDSATDFGELKTSPVYYQHGLDPVLKTRRLGRAELRADDFGVWAEAQLEMRDEYERFVYGLAEAGKLGWSSGTAGHLVEREPVGSAHHIKHWPLGLDASLTPTPAEPQNHAAPIKALAGKTLSELAQAIAPQAADGEVIPAAADPAQEPTPNPEPSKQTVPAQVRDQGDTNMSDETQEPGPDNSQYDALEAQVKATSANVEKLLGLLENTPEAERSGYASNLGGTNDPGHKSFGDWLLAVKRGDTKRLAKVYGSVRQSNDPNETKDLAGDVGAQGGYLVPEEFKPLVVPAVATSPIKARVDVIPVSAPSGHWPTLNYGTVPTAGSGQTAMAGGLTASTTEEGAAMTESTITFVDREWRVHKIGSYVEVTNELDADSPQSIEALLTSLIRIVIDSKDERNILRGSGSGEPLGILNAASTVAVTTTTGGVFAEADALKMLARHKNLSGQRSVWITHYSVLPDFAAFSDSSFVPLVDFTEGVSGTLLGLPLIYSEHMPQADGDDVLLSDLGSYKFFQRGGVEIDFSEHAAFTSDKGTWRFKSRNDGFPWLHSAITGADPTGSYTFSTDLYHDD